MKRLLQSCSVLMLLCAATAHAQLYKWVGPDGKVTYSDVPPPKTAAKVETRALSAGGSVFGDLPYELAEVTRSHPVTLYTTRNCAACDDGRKLLSERGIPFQEKTVTSNEDIARFKQAGGDGNLPMLTIGREKENGFEAGAWNGALTSAGYPETSRLPRNYRNPAAVAAAPAPQAVAAEKNRTQEQPAAKPSAATELPPAIGNAPPGFRF
ncbi:glutaredoxin family protein [Noviherbaspirillum aerium]|uniref:glutaredoxin family protein n=1 Tax=Noviherbaspirillum aerium TaxID=2588497 RepID=UPI00124D57B0|nr:glutaredoxin family protein [Noviherbaspirillum aerium]